MLETWIIYRKKSNKIHTRRLQKDPKVMTQNRPKKESERKAPTIARALDIADHMNSMVVPFTVSM
jgi:hypothetical protein